MSTTNLSNAIKAALIANIPHNPDVSTPTPTDDQISIAGSTANAIATAIVSCIESATVVYATGSLTTASGGGAVTEVATGVSGFSLT